MALNHGGDPLGSNLGPMGSHWGQKMGQNRKKLPCPKTRIFYYSAVIDLGKKSNLRLWRQITVGNTWGPSWGQWGPIGNKKWVKTVKNYHAPKFGFWLLRGHRFGQKIELTVMAPNHGGEPLATILGPMGSHWDQKWVKTVKNYHAQKFQFFTTPHGHRFGQKSNLWSWHQITVMTP